MARLYGFTGLLHESAFAPRNPYSKAGCQPFVGPAACKTDKVQLQVGAKLFMQQRRFTDEMLVFIVNHEIERRMRKEEESDKE